MQINWNELKLIWSKPLLLSTQAVQWTTVRNQKVFRTKVMQMLFIEINSELTCRLSHGQQRKLLRLTRTPQSALFFGELMDQISGFIYYSMFSI